MVSSTPARTITSCSGWIVATMSRIGPERGRSISASRMLLCCSAAALEVRSSSSNAVISPCVKPNRRRMPTPIGSVLLAR